MAAAAIAASRHSARSWRQRLVKNWLIKPPNGGADGCLEFTIARKAQFVKETASHDKMKKAGLCVTEAGFGFFAISP